MEQKLILDACCGSRMFWFDKNNPNTLFQDIRDESHTLCDGRQLNIKPDVLEDFTKMTHQDKTFKLVVFDPPHLENVGKSSWMFLKYGGLPKAWKQMLKDGFSECFRVLDDYGILIFKWNEDQIKTSDILKLVDVPPLFGHISGKQAKTHWVCFMKMPETKNP